MARGARTDRQLSLTTPLGPDVLLVSGFSGREALSQLFTYRLDLVAANDAQVPFDALLGQTVTLALALPTGGVRYFGGFVQRFGQGARGAKYTSYRAELVPQLWLLTRKATSRIFQRVSVPDILRQVLAGLNVDFQLQGTFQPRNYCVQYRESDFSFASRLMEEEGIFYFFQHGADGHRLVVANTPSSHPDAGTVAYDPNATQKSPAQVVYQWEKEQELRSGLVTLRDHTFELPSQNLEARASILDSVPVGTVRHRLKLGVNETLELYDYPGGYAQRFDGIDRGRGEQPGELEKIFPDAVRTVGIRMEQEAVPSLHVAGASTARQLAAGHRFALQGHFNADGQYVLTGVDHSAQVANVESGDVAYTNQFTCIPVALPYRPQRTTPRPVIAGHQTAVVVGPAGQEIFTDKYGRVKVQFFWDREGKKDENSSCWIRVGAVWAGKQWGVIHIPEVGDEVVVAFEEGDPDRPIIVGSVYNAERLPPQPWPPPRQ
jgi:type VI secretion system secreted protein VgrG